MVRARLRMVMAGLAAVALMALGQTAAVADDASASISGTVLSASDGAPVVGASVSAWTDDAIGGATVTGEDGTFTISDLPAGSYRVTFDATDQGFVLQYWDGVDGSGIPGTLDLADGQAAEGIDAALVAGGSISGTVTRAADGTAVEGAEVQISGDGGSAGAAYTDAEGQYVVDGLPTGDYTVRFVSPEEALLTEYWESTTDFGAAQPVSVLAGETTAGIDASLDLASTITGTVTRVDDGTPVSGEVTALDERGMGVPVRIDDDGGYRIFVTPGTYLVQFRADDPALLMEYWDDAPTMDEAVAVAVDAGQEQTGIDATLAVGIAITGTVRADGIGLADVMVLAEGADGSSAVATTDSDGAYRLYVVPGEYVVRTDQVAGDPFYAAQFHPGAASRDEATPIEIGEAGATGIDFDLQVGGDIRGSVTVDGGIDPESEGLVIVAYRWTDGAWGDAQRTPTWGTFTFNGWGIGSGPLPAGRYRIGVETAECTQFYGGAEPTTIDLAAGEVVEGIEIALTPDCGPVTVAPTLTLSTSTAAAGSQLRVTGTGFLPGERVHLELHSTPMPIGTLTADAEGRIDGTVTIPVDAPVGAHRVVAFGAESGFEASVAITVRAGGAPAEGGGATVGSGTGAEAGDALASTGSAAPTLLIAIALALLVLGGFLTRRSVFAGR